LYLGEVEPWRGRWYDPRVDAPEVLQEFTRLREDAEAYARFASQYGLLGLAGALPLEEPEEGEFGTAPLEAVADWTRTSLELRTVAALHGALVAGDKEALDQLIVLDEGWISFGDDLQRRTEELLTLGGYEIEPPNAWDAGQNLGVTPLALVAGAECEDGDIERAAWDLLAWSINTRTQSLIGYGLRAPDPTVPNRLELALSPKGELYGWLWLQLAEQIAADRPMQRCANCSDWFFQHPEARRQHGMYCTTKCRVAAWRKRRTRD
jgi:hypothetical protein